MAGTAYAEHFRRQAVLRSIAEAAVMRWLRGILRCLTHSFGVVLIRNGQIVLAGHVRRKLFSSLIWRVARRECHSRGHCLTPALSIARSKVAGSSYAPEWQ
jgi:hypothetical protein